MSRTLTASDRSALIRLAATLPAGSEDRRAILTHARRTASVIDDLALRALRSGQVVGTPVVAGYRVAPEGIVVDLTGVSVVLPPSKEVAAAVFSGAAPADVSRLVSMLPALAPFAPVSRASPASKLPAAQFKSKAKAMVQRGLDAYSSEDLMALVEGQKKEVPKGTAVDGPGSIYDLIVDIVHTLDRTPGYDEQRWSGTVDDIGDEIASLHLSVAGGAVTASGEMGFQTKAEPFVAKKPMRAYEGTFAESLSLEEVRRVVPQSTLRHLKLSPDSFGVEFYAHSSPEYNWPDIPTLDLRGIPLQYVNYLGPYKVNIPLRSLSRKALEDLVRVLAA